MWRYDSGVLPALRVNFKARHMIASSSQLPAVLVKADCSDGPASNRRRRRQDVAREHEGSDVKGCTQVNEIGKHFGVLILEQMFWCNKVLSGETRRKRGMKIDDRKLVLTCTQNGLQEGPVPPNGT